MDEESTKALATSILSTECGMIALTAFFGAFVVDAVELYTKIKANGMNFPKGWNIYAVVVAESIRAIAGIGFAVVLWKTGQLEGLIGAMSIGAAAPLFAEKLSTIVPRASAGPAPETESVES